MCECINWTRLNITAPYNLRRSDGVPLVTNHHPNCPHYNDSLMNVWKVSLGLSRCYFDNEQDAKDMAGTEGQEIGVSGVIEITKEKMHREVLENLPEFDGF